MAGRMHGRERGGGHAWKEGMRGGGLCMAGETVTAADGMHPTGMHS